MVAYSFNRRFAPLIISGEKTHTVRKSRHRDARPGEELQLYTGMRTKTCQLIGRATCAEVLPIVLDLGKRRVTIGGKVHEAEAFARSDGFEDWADLCRFWAKNHPGVAVFRGIIIRWKDFRR
ncbi:MAG: hypothetical protein AB7I42_26435 [Bradyrhizobium sp.]|uniref:hypothetical protein n=1 Tax=Bradyrhizobium sp. TaxID=376 RepID=UPI003D0D1FAC